MSKELVMRIEPRKYGRRCHVCNKMGYATGFQLWQKNELLRNVWICDACLGTSIAAPVTLQRDATEDPVRAKILKDRIKTSRKMEAALAERVGGKAQPASGSSRLSGFKGDVRKVGSWRIEHKFTRSLKSWTLHFGDLAKIMKVAMDAGEYPALVLEMASARGSFAIIPLTLFLEMVDATDDNSTPARRRSKGS